MKITLEAKDYDEIRDEARGNIPFVPTNDQIDAALAAHPELFGLAVAWGWGDTEVRELLCAALEKLVRV
jgi:hypothetical protein